jgi:hypothetical protein
MQISRIRLSRKALASGIRGMPFRLAAAIAAPQRVEKVDHFLFERALFQQAAARFEFEGGHGGHSSDSSVPGASAQILVGHALACPDVEAVQPAGQASLAWTS